jgi:LAO/AO transport system kinase
MQASGDLETTRHRQSRAWMWALVEEGLQQSFRDNQAVAAGIPALERDVEARKITPAAAARVLLDDFLRS